MTLTTALRPAEADVLSRIEMAAPRGGEIATVFDTRPLAPFSEAGMGFITALSKLILTDRSLRAFPELIAFAHWMRKRNLLDLKTAFETRNDGRLMAARGLALHIAPANVDTIFLYSVLLSLLAGNSNIVRISSRRSAQIELLIGLIDRLLADPEHAETAARLAVVRYERDDAVNAAISARADLRVLWGGDTSVMALRAIAAQAHTKDVSFPDRWSLAVLDAAAIIEADADRFETLVTDFVNDTYWFGQMACSSPRMVVWQGDDLSVQKAAARFWARAEDLAVRFRDEIFAVDYVNKLVTADEMAIDGHATHISAGRKSNILNVVRFDIGARPDMSLHTGSGLFLETRVETLRELAPALERKTQSVVSFGISRADWVTFLSQERPVGIDRIVPVGQALTFASVWDGMDLLTEFTREISISV
ncbi:hypothetical protein KBY29_21725 [Ruegeria pomeroyi]|nr:hypothetical protein [Ruegeria pomeroyi]